MNDTNNFLIGTTRTNPGHAGLKFFFLKPGNNLFRVLPPMFSLAADGAVSKWWSCHRGFRNTQGKQKTFACIEEKDHKTKTIRVRCPICDAAKQVEMMLEKAKQNGATKEQLSQANQTQLAPLQAEKRFWLNVIDVDGQIGLLSINYKHHELVKNLLNTQFAAGFDPTGMNGCYLNFTKVQAYKGDPQTAYGVALAVEQSMQNGVLNQTVKMHTLTPEIIERVKVESRDLTKLFPALTGEQMAILIQLSGVDQQKALETFLSGPEKTDVPPTTPNTISIPGTTAQACVAPVVNNGQLGLAAFGSTPQGMPVVQQNTPPQTPAAFTVPQQPNAFTAPQQPVAPAPVFTMPQAAPAAPAAPIGVAAPAQAPAPLSDADFIKMFQPS